MSKFVKTALLALLCVGCFTVSGASWFVRGNKYNIETVIITGNSSYVPAQVAYTYRNYEIDTGFYAEGSAELLADAYVEMLTSLKNP